MAEPNPFKDWQAPPAAVNEETRLKFLNECTEEGRIWHNSQRGHADFRKAMDILAGRTDTPDLIRYRSKLKTNRLKRNIREIVGALANVRPLWGYHSDNQAFLENASMMNKVSRAVYLENFFDRSLKEALQYAAATCTGWVRPVYRRNMAGRGKGNLQLLTYGSPCVLPVQMPSNNDWQEAYVVTLLDEMPIYMAHSLFPDHQDRLHPTMSQYWYSKEIHTASAGNLWKRMIGTFRRRPESALADVFIPVRYTYIIDNTVNTTGQMIPMGQIGTRWYYEVPSYNSDIPAGRDSNGTPIFRKATEDDARLYPYRRLMISSENCIMYDGPAFDWHGELPLIPFCVDDWPWEAIGFSLVHDGYELQESIDEVERGMMDKLRAQNDLPLGYDINSVSAKEAKQFDPMQPRARIGFDGSQVDKPFAPVVPPEVYRIEAEGPALVKHYEETMDYQLAIRDVVSLAKARAMGRGSEEKETLMLADGPIVRDISRSMERGLSRIGSQLKYQILQYMDTRRIIQYVGEDGVSQEILDYDPNSLVPSHLPGEAVHDTAERPMASQYSMLQRARWFAENLRFIIMPHSLHEITQMSHRLMLLQLKRAGAPVDWGTIFEAVNIPDNKMAKGSSVQERFWNEKEEELEHMIRVGQMAKEMGINPDAMKGLGQHGGGRSPSGAAPPKIASKDGGTRSTIKESS